MSELEQYLRTIIGPVKVEGFPSKGQINTEIVKGGGGFGQMDGLMFYGEPYVNELPPSYMVVTTKSLLNRYVSPKESVPKKLQEWPYDEDFYSRVFDWDRGFSNFGELQVHNKDATSIVHAFLMLSAQDIGPYFPGEIVVFLTKADKIFLIDKDSKSEIKPIPECEAVWDKYEDKARKLHDKKDFEGYSQSEEDGFQAYKKCFAAHLKEQKYYPALKEEAQSIVNNLQKD